MHEQLATETRKLAAIMFTDMVGFSRQMGADEARAEVAEVLRLIPNASLKVSSRIFPSKIQWP